MADVNECTIRVDCVVESCQFGTIVPCVNLKPLNNTKCVWNTQCTMIEVEQGYGISITHTYSTHIVGCTSKIEYNCSDVINEIRIDPGNGQTRHTPWGPPLLVAPTHALVRY